MSDVKTISKEAPELQSMRFDELREIALERIRTLSKEVWTDYNFHDPGVTTLEALCYAITDLGYRLTFDMQDLLANDPLTENEIDFKNFFTARQILHNAPVTIKDFRKLLMDVAIQTEDTHEVLGIKNAWLQPSKDAEVLLFVDSVKEALSYSPNITDSSGFFVKGLYNFLFEFDRSETLGDLNSNAMSGKYIIHDFSDPLLDGVEVSIEIHFPRWDDVSVDFADDTSIITALKSLTLTFSEMPTGYTLKDDPNDLFIALSGIKMISGVPVEIAGLSTLTSSLNDFVFIQPEGVLQQYKRKIAIVKEILNKAMRRLQSNRPLCEDYLNTKALKVEGIAVCGDVEIDTYADAATVAAHIYFALSQFLSPDVFFYSLPEMLSKGKITEEIFDGPALEHGFIDDEELEASEQKCALRSSDFIRMILDVEIDGKKPVKSVSGLQLANFPEDDKDSVIQKSVKWCLSLAIDKFYVPRLSTSLSNLSFFKNGLPFSFDEDKMNDKLNELFASAKKRYPENPILDKALPKGNWRETTNYTSIQEDFPKIYGVGSSGIPNLPNTEPARGQRMSEAKQFKGFLSFFDQLLYDYLQQINGLKSLFSLNQEMDEFGQPLLGKTYFSASLKGLSAAEDVVPNATDHALFSDGYRTHLSEITESKTEYEKRKNRFLDHLLARFCEQFSDYALIAYTLDGQEAGAELIKDKLAFLNSYPKISSNRGKAFNYNQAMPWFKENVSGYEDRVSMLMGVDAKSFTELHFSSSFKYHSVANQWHLESKLGSKVYFVDSVPLNNENSAIAGLEKLISAGTVFANYTITKGSALNKFQVLLFEDSEKQALLAKSKSSTLSEIAANTLVNKHIELCTNELLNNAIANRKNLALPIYLYFEVLSHTVDNTTTPFLHTIKYQLFDKPLPNLGRKMILKGELEGAEVEGVDALESKQNTALALLWKLIKFGADEDYYRFVPENVNIYEPDYRFEIFDIYGTTLGQSTKKNYNRSLAEAIENSVSKKVDICNSTANNGSYAIKNTVAIGPNIKVEIKESLPSNYPDGVLNFSETFSAYVYPDGRKITVSGIDLRDRLRPGDKMSLILPPSALLDFTILSLNFSDGNTHLITDVPIDYFVAPKVMYSKAFAIKSLTTKTIIIKGGQEKLAVADSVAFFNKIFIEREGIHLIEHILLRPKTKLLDKLLDIHTDVDCAQCKITDTYSFVMTAVMPYWPERFRDRNFRIFIENTLRSECPAHTVLNVCWVSPAQMDLFEKSYKKWLININSLPADDADRVASLKEFIECIQKLRSVYPSGKLHSCQDGEAQKNTLILNQTNIGIF